jgi:hypothetical protein
MKTICGLDCCGDCDKEKECGGCQKTDGHPFGGHCVAAEIIRKSGMQAYEDSKKKAVEDFNSLGIESLHITDLNLVLGAYINMEYKLPNGKAVKLLKDKNVYWGNQVQIPDSGTFYGIGADENYLIVSSFELDGSAPELLLYKKR